MQTASKYPNTFYRVSVKALIKNDAGELLVLKENQDTWSLPGGGLDHGEEPIAGLKRELAEELGITTATDIKAIDTKTFYLESKQAWLLWAVFSVKIDQHDFTLGVGVTEAIFINPAELQNSDDVFEKLVYEVANRRE